MKRLILIVLCLLSRHGFAQSQYGIYGGEGFTTSWKSGNTPTIGVLYLTSPLRHIYTGGALFFEGYSMFRADNEFARFGGIPYTIKQNCSYLFVTPRIDVTVGHHEHLHGFFTCGPGFFLSGEQSLALAGGVGTGVNPGLSYDSSNSSKNINHLIFRFSFGVSWHLTLDYWDIIISPEWAIIPSWLSTNTYGYSGDAAMNMKTNYISVTLGLLRKHNWSLMTPTRSWGGY